MSALSSQLAKATLSEICKLVTDGTHDTPKRVDEGFPLIKAKEIVGGRIDFKTCDQISLQDHLEVIARSKPEKGDTLFTHIGASLGEAAYVNTDRPFSIKNIALFKPDPAKINGRYLYYLVISPEFQAVAKAARTGSAQPFLSLGHLRSHPLRYHKDLSDQERIASILGAYDDLIEVNRRRIALLEEMARRLFEEWFVRFRFPGHEEIANGSALQLHAPENWTTLAVGEAFEIVGGGTPRKGEERYWNEGTINWYTPSDLTSANTTFMDASSLQITQEGLQKSSAQLFPPFSVMMTSRATLGVISINTTEASTNQGFITCIPNARVPLSFLYQWLRANVPLFVAQASGSTFKEITKGTFRKLPVTLPSPELVALYEERTRSMLELMLRLERSQRLLKASRDLLLPRLICGDLSIAAADRKLEAAE